jgi:hypothetical protein
MSIIPLPANALATCGEGSDGNQKREKPNRTQMRPKTTLCYRTPGILWQLKSAHNTRGQQKNYCLLLSYTLKMKQNHFLQSSSVGIDVNCPVRVVSSELLRGFFL